MALMASHDVGTKLGCTGLRRYRIARYVGWVSTKIVCMRTPLQQCILAVMTDEVLALLSC